MEESTAVQQILLQDCELVRTVVPCAAAGGTHVPRVPSDKAGFTGNDAPRAVHCSGTRKADLAGEDTPPTVRGGARLLFLVRGAASRAAAGSGMSSSSLDAAELPMLGVSITRPQFKKSAKAMSGRACCSDDLVDARLGFQPEGSVVNDTALPRSARRPTGTGGPTLPTRTSLRGEVTPLKMVFGRVASLRPATISNG